MYAKERLNKILNILDVDGKVIVNDLSEKFNVTQDCIRKDLNKLEKEGHLQRIYGGGILPRKYIKQLPLTVRKNTDLDIKKKIAEKALGLIKENDTIFLGLSTTNTILAHLLAESKLPITIITNMIGVVQAFEYKKNSTVVCIGGVYKSDEGGFTGSETINVIQNYKFDKAFLGACGINIVDNDITSLSIDDKNTKKAIISRANNSFILMENKKFEYDGIYKFATLNDITGVVTENQPSDRICEILIEHGVEII